MDRPPRRSGLLIFAVAALFGTALAAAGAPPLRALRWLAPGVDPGVALTHRPAECLTANLSPEAAYEAELGRAAFRTPLLLGGQAARAGVACETCHRGGHANPEFRFPGVSGAPGTADVTTSVLSSHRGDGIDNPKPIPDLSGPKAALKVDQDPASGKLEAFIDGVITQEFDGAEPPPAVLKGLAAYVRALSPEACPGVRPMTVTAAGALEDARRAVRAALAALERHDPGAAIFMAEAARSQLGDMAERYAGPDLAAVRGTLALASGDLAAAEDAIRRDPTTAIQPLALWLARSGEWGPGVTRLEARTLYDPRRLRLAARAAG